MLEEKLIIESVYKNETSLVELFSDAYWVVLKNNNWVIRYVDKGLPGMYDHNFWSLDNLEEDDIEAITTLHTLKRENHIKISSNKPLPLLEKYGFENEIILTMLNKDYKSINPKSNYLIEYKNVKDNEEIINDVIATEIIYYGKSYGISFCVRRWNHYFNKIKEGNNGLNIFACYYGNRIAGYCYTYYSDGVVGLDGLLVVEEFRNMYVASNLIKYVANFYSCPIYLHASEDETAKELYKKLNFVTINKTYDYLKIDDKK